MKMCLDSPILAFKQIYQWDVVIHTILGQLCDTNAFQVVKNSKWAQVICSERCLNRTHTTCQVLQSTDSETTI